MFCCGFCKINNGGGYNMLIKIKKWATDHY